MMGAGLFGWHGLWLLHGVALGLGEAPAAASAGLLLLACLARRGGRFVGRALADTWMWPAAALVSAGVATLGPFGLRPSALGSALPTLAPAVALAATRAAGPAAVRRAALAYLLTVHAGAALALACGAAGVDLHAPFASLAASSHRQAFAPGTGLVGVGGWFGHRFKLAVAVALAGSLAVGMMLGGRRALGGAALCASGMAFVPGQVRAVWAAWLVSVAAVAVAASRPLWSWHWRKLAAGAACVLLGVAGLARPLDRPLFSGRAGVEERGPLWDCGRAIVQAAPLGVGLGNLPDAMDLCFEAHVPLTRSPRTGPHQSTLSALATGGPLALALQLFGFGSLALRAFVALWRRPHERFVRGVAGSCACALSTYALAGLLHDVLQHTVSAWAVYFSVGVWWAWVPSLRGERDHGTVS